MQYCIALLSEDKLSTAQGNSQNSFKFHSNKFSIRK